MNESSSQKKARLLGMPYGTATNQLRKMLLFECVKMLGADRCYRCGNKIENLKDFSIEHTIPWQGTENPSDTFFDLSKIAYSHLSCNSGAGLRYLGIKESTKHGTSARYDKGCRCEECVEHHSQKGKSWKRRVNYRNINKL